VRVPRRSVRGPHAAAAARRPVRARAHAHLDRLRHQPHHPGLPPLPAVPAGARRRRRAAEGARGVPWLPEGIHGRDGRGRPVFPRWGAVADRYRDRAVAVRLWVFDHFKEGGLGVPEEGKGGEDEKAWARWRKWLAAVESRKSLKETTSDREHYLPIYQRYADDVAQSELAKATRSGRGVP